MNIVLFCGGRGNSNLIRQLVDNDDVQLTLIINAYDDGLSTGEIRRLIPGMLGPSDFRKNLSLLLVPASESQLIFAQILEHRLQLDSPGVQGIANQTKKYLKKSQAEILIGADVKLSELVSLIPSPQKKILFRLVNSFLSQVKHKAIELQENGVLRFQDYAFGNLLLAGAYIQNGFNFSKANDYICSVFDIGARILNISDENRYLVGLTQDGELIRSEAKIVAGDFLGKIKEVYLVEHPLTDFQCKMFNALKSIDEKSCFLASLEKVPSINAIIKDVLSAADFIIFGSGTQHSSLFPTYKVLAQNGLTPLTWGGTAKRVFIGNLDHDLDILDWSGKEILEAFSAYFGGIHYSKLIDAVISEQDSQIVFPPEKSIAINRTALLRSSANRRSHDGEKLAKQIYSVDPWFNRDDCEIVVLNPVSNLERSRMNTLLERWDSSRFNHNVVCKIIKDREPSKKAIEIYNDWINDETKSRYLVLYACDGETNFNDLLAGIELLESGNLGVLNGSRTQARRQWLAATGKTYGEGRLRFNLSVIAMLTAVTLSMLRRQQILTDPLSRCLMLDRYSITSKKTANLFYKGETIPGLRTFLTSQNISAAEFPIRYKVFRGFRSFVDPTKDALKGFIEIMKQPK
jgi:2-phospho-L-lactate transferase/gluconeogenesis factor (CofD/UPF0052 family)